MQRAIVCVSLGIMGKNSIHAGHHNSHITNDNNVFMQHAVVCIVGDYER